MLMVFIKWSISSQAILIRLNEDVTKITNDHKRKINPRNEKKKQERERKSDKTEHTINDSTDKALKLTRINKNM